MVQKQRRVGMIRQEWGLAGREMGGSESATWRGQAERCPPYATPPAYSARLLRPASATRRVENGGAFSTRYVQAISLPFEP